MALNHCHGRFEPLKYSPKQEILSNLSIKINLCCKVGVILMKHILMFVDDILVLKNTREISGSVK